MLVVTQLVVQGSHAYGLLEIKWKLHALLHAYSLSYGPTPGLDMTGRFLPGRGPKEVKHSCHFGIVILLAFENA